jgi:hypothetical protein
MTRHTGRSDPGRCVRSILAQAPRRRPNTGDRLAVPVTGKDIWVTMRRRSIVTALPAAAFKSRCSKGAVLVSHGSHAQ